MARFIKLTAAILFLAVFSQGLEAQRPVNTIDGNWVGQLVENDKVTKFNLVLLLRQDLAHTRISGEAILVSETDNDSARFIINGTLQNDRFVLYDANIKSWSSNRAWCKKSFSGLLMNGSMGDNISGEWHTENNRAFFAGRANMKTHGSICAPGTFYVRRIIEGRYQENSGTSIPNANGNTRNPSVISAERTESTRIGNQTYTRYYPSSDNSQPPSSGTQNQMSPIDDACIAMVKSRKYNIWNKLKGYSMLDFKDAYGYAVIDRYPNDQPKMIRFNYVMGYKLSEPGEWSALETNYAEVIFKDGLPIAIHHNRSAPAEYAPFPYQGAFGSTKEYGADDQSDLLTAVQKIRIDKLYDDFRTELMTNNPSYQEVLRRHNAYPKEFNMKNCLAIVHKKGMAVYVAYSANRDFGEVNGATSSKEELKIEGGRDFAYYKNISNHPIIIKGIWKHGNSDSPIYTDESIRLEPGQITDYFKIGSEYYIESIYNVQYFGDTGIIKDIK